MTTILRIHCGELSKEVTGGMADAMWEDYEAVNLRRIANGGKDTAQIWI